VPLRAFWCKARVWWYVACDKQPREKRGRYIIHMSEVELSNRCSDLIATPLACMVKLIYLDK